MKRIVLTSGVMILLIAAWALKPLYEFYAHRGIVPLPPWGWVSLDAAAPQAHQLMDQSFETASTKALEEMEAYRSANNLPSLSAAVAFNGQLVWAGSAGYSDIAERIPATPKTLYRIGSTSKALTATALARLVDRGAVDLDQPVAEYSLSAAAPVWREITARQLASHSAGTPHYGENADFVGLYRSISLSRHYDDVRDSLAVFDTSPLLFTPGTDFHYSSLGTVLLGAVMSDASGLSYRELMNREVFGPAGMISTFPDGDMDSRQERLATWYFTDGARFRPWRDVDLSHRLPGGGYISSPTDLALLGAVYFDRSYLSEETRATFWTPQRLANGLVNEQNYALGWRWWGRGTDGDGRAAAAHHGGVSRGSQCWLLVYPDHLLSTAFCTNTKTESFDTFGGFHEPLFRVFAESLQSAAGASTVDG